MNEALNTNLQARAAERLLAMYHGPAWHGPALRETVDGVDAATAQRRTGAAHTIWELVGHIAAWNEVIRRRLSGENIDSLSDAENFPAAPPAANEAVWQALLARLQRSVDELAPAIHAYPDERLRVKVAEREYDVGYMIESAADHIVYHAGQIALLRRAAEQR
jgi:uncharacterized damage-inducible protein DinB